MSQKEYKHYAISLIDNFEADFEEIRLSDKLRIVRLDKLTDPSVIKFLGEEKINIAKQFKTDKNSDNYIEKKFTAMTYPLGCSYIQLPAELLNYGIEYKDYFIVKDGESSKHDWDCHGKLFNDVIISLRLLKNREIIVGRLESLLFHYIEGICNFGGSRKIEELNHEPSSMNSINKYVFLNEDIQKLKDIFKAVNNCNRKVEIALNRLNRVPGRKNPIDWLIDLMIGFEAIYLTGNTELSFRLAIRVARHLGKDETERKNIYNAISCAYGLRSEILHGSENDITKSRNFKKGGWKTPYKVVIELEELLRKSLLDILSSGDYSSKEFTKRIDHAIITGEDLFSSS